MLLGQFNEFKSSNGYYFLFLFKKILLEKFLQSIQLINLKN